MKLITSPAKLMNIKNSTEFLSPTTPVFIKDSEFIQSFLKEKSPKFLSELMEISSKLADENWERNQKWTATPNDDESTFALFAFVGEVYKGLSANTLSINAINYLQENYRILSGLYGLLKPSDRVMLYRLEMGRPFQFDKYKNIYDFWTEKVSNEYSKVINRKLLKGRWIDFDFQQIKDGKPKTIVVYTKHARGLMVRFCSETNAQTLNDVKAFNYEGYYIDEERSTDTKLVFIR